MKLCSVAGCERKVKVRGMCQSHYQKAVRAGEIVVQKRLNQKSLTCYIKDCNNVAISKLLCNAHYQRVIYSEEVNAPLRHSTEGLCLFEGCDRKKSSKGLCLSHYSQKSRGKPLTPILHKSGYTTRGICRIEGCETKVKATGLCASHYHRKYRGTLTESGELKSVEEYNNRVEDTEELLRFGVTVLEEFVERAGWLSEDNMRKQLPKELWEKVKMQCLS